jgi:hypothetical protein
MAVRKLSVLVTLLVPTASAAQLIIAVSPSANIVHAGSTLKFTAYVPPSSTPVKTYALRCTEPATGCGYSVSYPSTVSDFANKQFLTFASYTVPSSLKPGVALCFEVFRPGKSVKSPYGATITVWKDVVVASACKQVTAPDITARDASKASGVALATPAIAPSSPSLGSRTASSGGARAMTTARSTAGSLPDLVITFEKGPVARWIVRNVGTSNAPATSVEFRRLGVTGSTSRYVGGLAPGASAAITVTPELDIYLVNATADVDPSSKVQELDETNNRWASVESR